MLMSDHERTPDHLEVRDLERARCLLTQGLWLQQTATPLPPTVQPALDWGMEIASGGQPLPPIGFVADLGRAALRLREPSAAAREAQALPGLPAGLLRVYEDHVLGRLYGDGTFERASDALMRYQGRDQARG